ncbi:MULTISPECIES: signal peptidase II [Actinomycetes]|uniref:Lipoprotein signal peptidase n=2 Tax=Mycolicibacterium TaxID=1866885 RepID=A0AAV2WKM1_MYCNE|nr:MULTISPECIES: signal peptidase II [Actinomycetes]MCF6388766.1 signal peptidase II [Mycobacterium sp. MBM]MCP9276361.1 signal peptidase II [Mycolicibacterium sp. CAU 1645]QZT54952.1 signal peptidase II [Mycolicibacterium austroafricanum]TLH62611.1 signal peptidase II [Mycolicibacterium neoaurum]TQK27607.1 signal peptidase II [Arthrobacter sp. SLBN-53]
MTAGHTGAEARVIRGRITLAATAVIAAGLDLGLKTWAARALNDGSSTDLGLLHLRLAFNPGVAFSLGDTLPPAVLLGVTGVIVVALAVFAVRVTRTAALPVVLALAAMLGGAVANLIDRAADGLVTDYQHTGWFPTFNLADVFVVGGGAVLAVASWRTSDTAATGAGA